MVDNGTNGICTAGTRARINALASYTSFISGAVIVEDTFRSAATIGIALIFWQTSAYSIVTLSVWTTWRWIARVSDNWLYSWRFLSTVTKRIACEALRARTDRGVVYNAALCTCTAGSRTGISAFFSYTRQITRTFWIDCTFWSTIRRASNVTCKTSA